jgi:hypothetical protein
LYPHGSAQLSHGSHTATATSFFALVNDNIAAQNQR